MPLSRLLTRCSAVMSFESWASEIGTFAMMAFQNMVVICLGLYSEIITISQHMEKGYPEGWALPSSFHGGSTCAVHEAQHTYVPTLIPSVIQFKVLEMGYGFSGD